MLVMLSVAVLLVAATAQAAVVNVDFVATSGATAEYVGLAAAPDAATNTLWNEMSTTGTDLTASDGTATTIDVALSGTGLNFAGPSSFHAGNTDLTGDRAVTATSGGVCTFTISGLANSTSYDIYLYATHYDTAGHFGTDFTIGETTLNANDAGRPPTATDGTGWTLGDDYVKFSVTSSAAGVITGTWTTDAGGYTAGMMSGMQIVPEPATMSLLGIGGLLALVRRKR